VCSDNVEYPIQPLEPFNVRSDASFGEAIGELGAFYCVAHYFDKKADWSKRSSVIGPMIMVNFDSSIASLQMAKLGRSSIAARETCSCSATAVC
jgi:hypothetical protein